MWTYSQTSGEILHDGEFVGTGYSGTQGGRNNPDAQNVQNVGPIPRGLYTIGDRYDDPHLGPCVMHVDPMPGTQTFGRSEFRIHGNNIDNDASKGCLVAGPSIRILIAASDDKQLTVLR